MSVKQCVSLTAIVVIALVAIGCRKSQQTEAVTAEAVVQDVPADPNTKNLGVVELANHVATDFYIGTGKVCTITPTILSNNAVQLVVAVETRNPGGQTQGLGAVRGVTQLGRPFYISVGDVNISLTPVIKGVVQTAKKK